MLVEHADDLIGQRIYNLREKKLEYLRGVCDPQAEYETKAQTIDRIIENDYLYFGSSRNKLEKEIYDIKTACKTVENNLRQRAKKRERSKSMKLRNTNNSSPLTSPQSAYNRKKL